MTRRAIRTEAIANFEKGVVERDALDMEIATVAARLAQLEYERDRLTISADTICGLLGWNREKAEAEARLRAANGAVVADASGDGSAKLL